MRASVIVLGAALAAALSMPAHAGESKTSAVAVYPDRAEVTRERVKVIWALKDQPWGARTFTVADPDGCLLTFMTTKANPHGECGGEE